MKILLIGDIVGNAGVKKVKQGIEEIKKKQNIDFIWYNNYGETLVKYTFYMERSKL